MVYEILSNTLTAMLTLVSVSFFLRAILSWFDATGEGKLSTFFYMVTEPLILPMRKLCESRGWFEGTPIDMPFMLTYLILFLLRIVVTVFL